MESDYTICTHSRAVIRENLQSRLVLDVNHTGVVGLTGTRIKPQRAKPRL